MTAAPNRVTVNPRYTLDRADAAAFSKQAYCLHLRFFLYSFAIIFSCVILILILPYSRYMSKEKSKKNNWGGKRDGAGRPPGTGKKMKICVSVNRENWHDALDQWKRKQSWLVDWLIADFINRKAKTT